MAVQNWGGEGGRIMLPNVTIFLALQVLPCYAEECKRPWIVIATEKKHSEE